MPQLMNENQKTEDKNKSQHGCGKRTKDCQIVPLSVLRRLQDAAVDRRPKVNGTSILAKVNPDF